MLAQDKVFDNFAILASAIKNYIPKQLLKNVNFEKTYAQNECKYIQKILDSNDHLRIVYGSAESLLEELKMYMNFPLSRKMFPIGMGNYHSTIPKIYKTLKKEHLYCKQDFLFYLQSCVYSELGLDDDEQKVKFEKLIVSMKKHEDRLSECYEFVKYDHDVFEDIRKPFICSQSLHVFKENPENTVVIADRRGETRIIPDEEKDFVDVFDNLISKYPCFFLPNSETKDKNATAVVRVFGHKYEKFVMESELFAAINLKNPDQKPLESMDIEGHYRTIEYKHVLERYRDQIDAIDFILHPPTFCTNFAIPIAAPTGDHCIQAVNALEYILYENSLLLGNFQKISRNTCHMIPKFVTILEKYFPSNIKYRYFMDLKLVRKLQEDLEEFWKPMENEPMKRVRNVGPQGFTVEDLKKELKYLGYTKIFPEITDEARAAHAIFFEQNELNTMSMCSAIHEALTRVMFKRYPCLNEFVYRQNVCPHIQTKPCEPCSKGIKEAAARIEAEIKAEFEQASSSVTATTSEDDTKKEEDSEKSKPESATSELPIEGRDSENLKNSVESSFVEAETKQIYAISESEVSEHNPASSNFNNQKMSRESCLKVTKGAEFEKAPSTVTATTSGDYIKEDEYSEESKPESAISEAPSIAVNNPVEAEINSLPAISKPEVPEHDTVLTDSNTHIFEKCVETSNEAREEVIETYRKMKILEKKLKEKDAELERLRVYEEKSKKLDETEKKMKDLEKEAEEWKMKRLKILEENVKMGNMLKRSENSIALKRKEVQEKNEQLKLAQKALEEKDQRCKYLDKTLKVKNEEVRNLTEAEKWEKQNKEDYKARVKELESEIKLNASKYADENKKLTARISENERAEYLLKQSNKGLLEKLKKAESSLQVVTNRRAHLEAEVAEKNRMILELQKSAENQVCEQEKTEKELETRISKIRGMLDEISPIKSKPEEKPDTECLICFDEMKPEQKTLKCEHCRKIVHFECASRWLDIHRSCAHCRREQLNPNEFPRLQ